MDIRTLLVCSVALLGLYTIVLLYAWRTVPSASQNAWLAATFASVTFGLAMGAGRGVLPDTLSIVVANTLVMAGYVLLHQAVAELLGKPRQHVMIGVLLIAALMVTAAYFTYVVNDAEPRIIVFSVLNGIQATLSAILLLRSPGGSPVRQAKRSVGVAILLLATASFVRAGLTMAEGSPADFMVQDNIQATSLLVFIVCSAYVAVAFLWLAGAENRANLQVLATRDSLTGLLNRRGFMEMATRRRQDAERDGKSLLLVFADLDGMKGINDQGGHDAGDRALRDAAVLIDQEIGGTTARLGGDEFCALVAVFDASEGDLRLQRLQDRVAARNARVDDGMAFGISAAAILIEPDESESLEELLTAVDQMMYVTKRARKEGVRP